MDQNFKTTVTNCLVKRSNAPTVSFDQTRVGQIAVITVGCSEHPRNVGQTTVVAPCPGFLVRIVYSERDPMRLHSITKLLIGVHAHPPLTLNALRDAFVNSRAKLRYCRDPARLR